MASKRRRDHTPLPWIAAIEALASNQTHTSLLTDLVKNIPGEFRENEGKNARELVCLRILESLSILDKGKSSRILPRPGSSARISPSDCCEHVLKQVQRKSSRANQESTESEISARDVEAFVRDKRSCLPKSALEQLKDVISKESDLISFSVKEMSGLLNKNHSDGNATRPETRPERSDSDAIENPLAGNLSSGKTVMSNSATSNQEGSSACNQLIVYKDYPNIASLKRKQDAFCAQKAVEGKDSDSSNKRQNVDDVPGAVFKHSGREDSDLPREILVENLRETITFENVDYGPLASKKLKMTSTVGDAEHHSQKMTQGISGKEHGLNIREDEAKKDCEVFVELETRGSSALFVNQGTKSVDGAKENSEHSFLLTPDSVRCGKVKATMKHDHQPETLSNDENDEILIRNSTILNSQYSQSQDSLATLNGTKKLCIVCKIGGQLLVCTSGSCQRVVHEKCMGVAPTFDAARSFYCPFCAYSLAISEYLESKKKYSLARRALVTFINRDEYRVRNSSNISRRADQNHLKDSEICNKCVEQSRVENVVSSEIENSFRENMRNKPSVSCDSSSSEKIRDVTCGANEVALENKRNAERGSSVCFQSPSELEQQVPVLGAQNAEAECSLHGGNEQLASVDKLQQVSHQPRSVAVVENENEGDQYVAPEAVQDSVLQNSISKDMKIGHGCKQHNGTAKGQNVSDQRPILPCEPAKPTHSGIAKSSGEKKKLITHPSLRVRKGEPQYTYPPLPQLKRKKIQWSKAEEEALKAGVKRFASNHDRQMPWKTILEFGGDVLVNRTTIDLKDKWRNICKGSPKV